MSRREMIIANEKETPKLVCGDMFLTNGDFRFIAFDDSRNEEYPYKVFDCRGNRVGLYTDIEQLRDNYNTLGDVQLIIKMTVEVE